MDGRTIAIPTAVTLAVQAMVSLVAVTVPVMAPTAAPDIGVSPTSVGLYVSLMYIGGMLASLGSGNFILRYGGLRVSQMCLLLCGAGLMLTALGTVSALLASAFIIGFGYGPVTPASSHILARNTPAHMRSFVFSLKQTGVPLGGVLAGAVVPTLVITTGWRLTSIIVGAACLLFIPLIQPIRAGIDSDRHPDQSLSFAGATRPLHMVLSHRPLRQLASISFFYSGMQLCLFTYLVIYLTQDIGMSLVIAGFALSAGQMAGTIGRIIWGILADRYIQPRLLLGILGIAMSAGAVGTALLSPEWPTPAVVIVVILFGATAIGWNGVYLAEAARLAPEGQVGTATGGTLFFTFLGVVLGPPLFGAVASVTDSYPAGYAFFAVLTLVSGTIALSSRASR